MNPETMSFKSLAEIAQDLPLSTGKNTFWAAFDYSDGGVGTWTSSAENADEFIAHLLDQQGDRIARLLELQQHVVNWPTTPNLTIDVARYNRMLKQEQDYDKTTGMNFGLERDLQIALRANINQLEAGLQIVDDGKERMTRAGRIDITATDSNDRVVVIELKAGRASSEAVDQIAAYMSAITDVDNQVVRGILIAANFSMRARMAARRVPNLELHRYSFQFLFQEVKP